MIFFGNVAKKFINKQGIKSYKVYQLKELIVETTKFKAYP